MKRMRNCLNFPGAIQRRMKFGIPERLPPNERSHDPRQNAIDCGGGQCHFWQRSVFWSVFVAQ